MILHRIAKITFHMDCTIEEGCQMDKLKRCDNYNPGSSRNYYDATRCINKTQ